MALPPSEELFRKKVILEAGMEVLSLAIIGIERSARDKRTAVALLNLVKKTLSEQRGMVLVALITKPQDKDLLQKQIRLDIMVQTMQAMVKGCKTLPTKPAIIQYLGDCGKEYNKQWHFLERELKRQRDDRTGLIEQHVADTKDIVRDSTNTPNPKA